MLQKSAKIGLDNYFSDLFTEFKISRRSKENIKTS